MESRWFRNNQTLMGVELSWNKLFPWVFKASALADETHRQSDVWLHHVNDTLWTCLICSYEISVNFETSIIQANGFGHQRLPIIVVSPTLHHLFWSPEYFFFQNLYFQAQDKSHFKPIVFPFNFSQARFICILKEQENGNLSFRMPIVSLWFLYKSLDIIELGIK